MRASAILPCCYARYPKCNWPLHQPLTARAVPVDVPQTLLVRKATSARADHAKLPCVQIGEQPCATLREGASLPSCPSNVPPRKPFPRQPLAAGALGGKIKLTWLRRCLDIFPTSIAPDSAGQFHNHMTVHRLAQGTACQLKPSKLLLIGLHSILVQESLSLVSQWMLLRP